MSEQNSTEGPFSILASTDMEPVDLDADLEALRIGHEWLKDSSLEKWFPITAEELQKLKAQVQRLREALRNVLKNLWKDQESELYDAVKEAKSALAETKEAR